MTNNPTHDELVELVAKAIVPALWGAREDAFGRDLPPQQFEDLKPDWQEASRGYARAAVEAIQPTLIEYRQQVQDLKDALEPFALFIEKHDQRPTQKVDDFYTIHPGSEWEASLRLSDLRAARDAYATLTKESRV